MTSKFLGEKSRNFERPKNLNINEDFLGVDVSWKK